MKFSEAWLREWVDPDVTSAELVEQLTMAGLEVDGTEPVAGECTGVVVARVIAVDKHPNADKLSVCRVDDGAGEQQVVCGAPNVRPGLVSVFARVGARLGEQTIGRAKVRGVESDGMLCSPAELGLGDDHSGIVELEAADRVGDDVRDVLALDDLSIDVDLTPNRGDCLSVRGVAREVGVLNGLDVAGETSSAVPPLIDDTFDVILEDTQGCPRYLGRVVTGVDTTRRSPLWLTEKLRRAGLRSIDPVVDVTNFVMLELGQPMHAFDLGELTGGIVVRRARDGESLTLLDGRAVTLHRDDLLITDASGPVAIAGVMGGERSGVQAATRDVFLESAFFAPLSIAATARRHGLHTDASHRFERGVDFELPRMALERATALLTAIVGGKPGPVTEAVNVSALPDRGRVVLRQRRLDALLGIAIDADEVDRIFARLGFQVADRESGSDGVVWTIVAPSHRYDIALEADLAEEVCRIYGYNNVPSRQPVASLSLRKVPLHASPAAELKRLMAQLGYHEAITYSFVDPRLQDLLAPGLKSLELANPMSSEQSVMRLNLLPGLVESLRANVSRQRDQVRLFEFGLTFAPGEPPDQRLTLGGLLWGRRHPERWNQPGKPVDFFDLKGDVERIIAWTGLQVSYRAADDPVLHPGQAAAVALGDTVIGRLGRLHPEIEDALELAEDVFVFELDGEVVLQRVRRHHRELSRFPQVRRDLALVVNQRVTSAEVEAVLREVLGEVLVDFRLFDLYEGKGIDSNEKSLAVGLTLQDASATLTEEEIGGYTDRAVQALAQRVGARLR